MYFTQEQVDALMTRFFKQALLNIDITLCCKRDLDCQTADDPLVRVDLFGKLSRPPCFDSSFPYGGEI
jgi:hypothetical protein